MNSKNIKPSQLSDNKKPIIGISGSNKTSGVLGLDKPPLDKIPVDYYSSTYALGVLAAGGVPVFLPIDANPVDYVNALMVCC